MLLLPVCITSMPEGEDRDFMEVFYMEYYKVMRGTAARYIRQEADIEDIISDCCLQLMKHIRTLRRLEEHQKRMYVIKTVRNASYRFCMKQMRRNSMISSEEEGLYMEQPAAKSAETLIEIEEEFRYVMEMIGKLPEKQRLVLQMKFQKEMKDAQIARATGLTESSARKYVERGRKNLKILLGMNG